MKLLKRAWSYFDPWKVAVFIGGFVLTGAGIGLRAIGFEPGEWIAFVGLLIVAFFAIGGWIGAGFELLRHPGDWPETQPDNHDEDN